MKYIFTLIFIFWLYNISYWSYTLWWDYIFAQVATSQDREWYMNYKINLDNYVFLSDDALKYSLERKLLPLDYHINIHSDVEIVKGDLLLISLPNKAKQVESWYINKLYCKNWKVVSTYVNQKNTIPSSEQLVNQFDFIKNCDDFISFFKDKNKWEIFELNKHDIVKQIDINLDKNFIKYKYWIVMILVFILLFLCLCIRKKLLWKK